MKDLVLAKQPLAVRAVLERVYAARGAADWAQDERGLEALAGPETLKALEDAVEALAGALARDERILVIGDYDAAI
ncbi:MAG: hypothetical protein ACYCTF_04755 [Acidiferrobacter sp.]